MTENIPQTSASERIENARKALAAFDDEEQGGVIWVYDLAEALRALITPPSVGDSEEALAAEFRAWITDNGTSRTLGTSILPADATDEQSVEKRRHDLTLAFTHGLRAGIQYAHERWEPADMPSQEQMLRWLEIDHDEPSEGYINIPQQFIERKEI